MCKFLRLLQLGIVTAMSWSACHGDDWRTWRGPSQSGHAQTESYFGDAPIQLNLVWQRDIGSSYSGLAVSRGQLLVPYADGESDWLGAFDPKNGEPIWKYRVGEMYPAHDGGHDGPLSTPVADDDRVYLLGPRGKLVAIDHRTGERIWSVNLSQQFSAQTPFWGFCTTPALNSASIFVQVSGTHNHGVIAFDKEDGSIRWQQEFDETDYRSPILTHFNGRPQLICCSRTKTCGFDPQTGERLWTMDFASGRETTPVRLADDQLLISGQSGTQRFTWQEDEMASTWKTSELRGNFSTPIEHGGYLYGFTRHALTCVDVKTGKRVWRSRRPGGGKGLVLVDDHLVIFSVTGDLIVVRATRDGYQERGRLQLSSADGYAAPAFADGRIFVRNLNGKVFAVEAGPASPQDLQQTPATHEFARFLRSLDNQENKDHAITEFLASHPSLPIVEDDKWVHFLYRGDADDVAIHGSMTAAGEEDALTRAPGTDLFYRSYEIAPGARWQYRLVVDFDKSMLDPKNPRVSPFDATRSELFTSQWKEPAWAESYAGAAGGRLETVNYANDTAIIYVPHGYDRTDDTYPLLVVTDGDDWLTECMVQDVLDHRYANGVEPSIVVFPTQRGMGGSNTADYARAVARDLVPVVEGKLRVRKDRTARTILGKRGGAVAAAFIALKYPDTFGHCIAISYGRADTVRSRAIQKMAEGLSDTKPTFRVSWNRYEIWRPQSFHCREQSQALSEMLRKLGYDVYGAEKNDSSNYRSWRVHFGDSLE